MTVKSIPYTADPADTAMRIAYFARHEDDPEAAARHFLDCGIKVELACRALIAADLEVDHRRAILGALIDLIFHDI